LAPTIEEDELMEDDDTNLMLETTIEEDEPIEDDNITQNLMTSLHSPLL
jgi:hypothetical protein